MKQIKPITLVLERSCASQAGVSARRDQIAGGRSSASRNGALSKCNLGTSQTGSWPGGPVEISRWRKPPEQKTNAQPPRQGRRTCGDSSTPTGARRVLCWCSGGWHHRLISGRASGAGGSTFSKLPKADEEDALAVLRDDALRVDEFVLDRVAERLGERAVDDVEGLAAVVAFEVLDVL